MEELLTHWHRGAEMSQRPIQLPCQKSECSRTLGTENARLSNWHRQALALAKPQSRGLEQ